MDQQAFRKIISGRDQRHYVIVLRMLFRILSLVYSIVVYLRNIGYSSGVFRSHDVGIPVISIGNITTGGTGKTPLVSWVCNYLHNKGIRSSILTRGYKTQSGKITDEPALLAKSCPGTNVVVNPNRIAGAKMALRTHKPDALVLDDGFQHRKLRRNLDIITIDATCPFGYGCVLPAGLLREPMTGLSRASAIIITRTDQVDSAATQKLHEQIKHYAPNIPIFKTAHKLSYAVSFPNQEISLESLKREKIFAFCGIGNPEAFFDSLNQQKMTLCGKKTFDDHHEYTTTDMELIYDNAKALGATAILCTQKDWVKSAILRAEEETIIFAYIVMELDFLEGFDKITHLIDTLFDRDSTENGKLTE